LALEKDGTVWQWGGGLWQDGTSVIRATLFADQGLANVGEIAAAVPAEFNPTSHSHLACLQGLPVHRCRSVVHPQDRNDLVHRRAVIGIALDKSALEVLVLDVDCCLQHGASGISD
jgi:hypothetical protein